VTVRTLGFILTVAAIVAAFLYDVLGPGFHTLPHAWDPRAIDWLLGVSLAVLGWYGVGAFLENPALARRYWDGFRERPEALVSLVFLVVFVLVALFGPVILGPPEVAPQYKFQPPVFMTADTAAISDCVGPITGNVCHGTWTYPLGTDGTGKDLLVLTTYGARVALIVALVSAAIIVPVAVTVGMVSGYVGGWADDVLMRYVDVQQTVPAIVVYLILMMLYGQSLFLIVLVFGLLSWGEVARLVRADVLRFREAAHVQAAEGLGASRLYVIRKHILPRVSPTVIAATTRKTPELILAQAALAFLDLNDVMVPSWGDTIANGLSHFWVAVPQKWWVSTIPVIALAATIVALNVLGNAFREVLDPRSQG
jgi:peptide/nickel transport system permease protein